MHPNHGQAHTHFAVKATGYESPIREYRAGFDTGSMATHGAHAFVCLGQVKGNVIWVPWILELYSWNQINGHNSKYIIAGSVTKYECM